MSLFFKFGGFRQLLCGFVLLLCFTFLYGCGGAEGPARYRISGTVKFKGEPVPRGMVHFFPNVEKGTTGPTGVAKIVNGKYDTSLEGGMSPVAGELTVQVEGFGPQVPNEEFAKPLFTAYRTDLVMPAKGHAYDIEVPVPTKK